MVSAFNAIISRKFDVAKKILVESNDKNVGFIKTKLNVSDYQKVLTNMLLSSSGSLNTRALGETITKGQVEKSYGQTGSAFTRQLLASADKLSPDQRKELETTHKNSIQALLRGLDPNNPTKSIGDMVGEDYRDMVGTITFSQVGPDGKITTG